MTDGIHFSTETPAIRCNGVHCARWNGRGHSIDCDIAIDERQRGIDRECTECDGGLVYRHVSRGSEVEIVDVACSACGGTGIEGETASDEPDDMDSWQGDR